MKRRPILFALAALYAFTLALPSLSMAEEAHEAHDEEKREQPTKHDEQSDSNEQSGKRVTESRSTWTFPYNESLVRDGYFVEANATSKKYFVVGLSEMDYQTEMTVEAELRV